jgi:hypothetical protein
MSSSIDSSVTVVLTGVDRRTIRHAIDYWQHTLDALIADKNSTDRDVSAACLQLGRIEHVRQTIAGGLS